MTEPAESFPRQSGLRLIAFSIAGLAIGGAQTAVVLYLPAFYAQRSGLSLAIIGSIFMICRLLNAFSDPVIGVLSDRTQTRFGRRKPWVIGGGLLFLAAIVATYMPPAFANSLYLGIALFALYLGNSAFSTPLYAWAGSLSPYYHERTRNQTYLQTVVSLGLVTMLVLPIAAGQSKVEAGTIANMGIANIAALVIGLPILAFWFKERPSPQLRRHLEFGAAIRLLATDRVVLRVIGSDFFVSLGQGFRGALLVLFVTYYMKLPSITIFGTSFSPIFVIPLIQYGFGVLASPIWGWIGRRLGKNRTLIVAEVTQIIVNLMLLLLEPGQYWAVAALALMQGLSQGSGNLMLRAIVSDVADQERLRTGKDHSGLLFSIFNVTINAAMALSVGIALPLVHQFGFSPGVANSPAALSALQWLIAIGPAIGHGLSAILMLSFPLTEAKHAEIVRALAEQAAAAPAPDAFTQAEESAAAAAART